MKLNFNVSQNHWELQDVPAGTVAVNHKADCHQTLLRSPLKATQAGTTKLTLSQTIIIIFIISIN